jgi:hypothetical protein
MHILRRITIIGAMLGACLLVPAAALAAPPAPSSPAQASATALAAHPVTVVVNVKPGVPWRSATGCTRNALLTELVCIYVNGTGRIVNYATVTNKHAPTGQAIISDTNDGVTYYGPFNFGPGKAWRHNFYLVFSNNTKVCGSVSGLDVACVLIHS